MKTAYFELCVKSERIWCALDRGAPSDADRPLVVIAPGYERTARDGLLLAKYLVVNGFDVLRFDARRSVGLSSGDMVDFTLSSLTDDLAVVLDHAHRELRSAHPLGVLSVSLSSRALVRCLERGPGIAGAVVTVVGVVDLRSTIARVVGEDVFTGHERGVRYGTRKLLTYEIDWDHFIADAIRHRLDTLEGCLEEAGRLSIDTWGSVVTEKDDWTDAVHQKQFLARVGARRAEHVVIEGAGHKIWKNPRSAQLSMMETVRILHKHYFGGDLSDQEIARPDVTDVVEFNRAERRVIAEWPRAQQGLREIAS